MPLRGLCLSAKSWLDKSWGGGSCGAHPVCPESQGRVWGPPLGTPLSAPTQPPALHAGLSYEGHVDPIMGNVA